jgi:hypothetical protein
MMSRPAIRNSLLALSLVMPMGIDSDALALAATAQSAPPKIRATRVAASPMRASGARTRTESLGIAAPAAHRAAVPDDALLVQPMTSVQETAAILMRTPPGKRIVHIAGFAGDITAYGDAKSVATRGAAHTGASAGSGLELGIDRVFERVRARMQALRAAGARIDAFFVEHPSSLPAGPFGETVLAEAVDSAVMEVFPRAESRSRSSVEALELAEADGDPEADVANDAAVDVAGPQGATPGATHPAAPPVHWETAVHERGLSWERIMDDTRRGVHATATR